MSRRNALLFGLAVAAAAAGVMIVATADESVAHPEPQNLDNVMLHGDQVTLPYQPFQSPGRTPVDEGYIVVVPYNQLETFKTRIGDDRFNPGPLLADRGRLPITSSRGYGYLSQQNLAPWPTIELPSNGWQLELTPGPQTICYLQTRDNRNSTYCLVVDLQRSTRLQFDADQPGVGAVRSPEFFILD